MLLLFGRGIYFFYLCDVEEINTRIRRKQKRKLFKNLIWIGVIFSILSFIPSKEELIMFILADNIDTYIAQHPGTALTPQSILQSIDNTGKIILGISEEIKMFFEGVLY